MRRLVTFAFLGAGALATLLASCGRGPAEPSARIYRHALDEAPTSLDPVHAATIYSNYVIRIAYDTLYAYKYLARPYELQPNLAASMAEVSGDGLTYTIPIKHGVMFGGDSDNVISLGAVHTRHALDGEVVALGGTAGESDLARTGADELSHLGTSVLDMPYYNPATGNWE